MRKRRKNSLLDSAGELTDTVVPKVESAVEAAVGAFRENAVPVLKEGKKIAKQKAKQGQKLAKQKAKEGRRLAEVKAAAFTEAPAGEKISAFRAAEPKRKGTKVKKLLLLGGLIAIGTVIVKRLMGAPSRTNWQSTYSPPPAPKPSGETSVAAAPAETSAAPAPETAPASDDAGGASPDEALSDAAAEPHPDTTPDEPAEVVELQSFAESRKPDPLTDPLPEDVAREVAGEVSTEQPPPTEASMPEESAPEESMPEVSTVEPAAGEEELGDPPYGPGSALPQADGSAPGPSFTIKGNKDSMLFHTMESPWFERVNAAVWFTNEVAAEAAGFRHWKSGKEAEG